MKDIFQKKKKKRKGKISRNYCVPPLNHSVLSLDFPLRGFNSVQVLSSSWGFIFFLVKKEAQMNSITTNSLRWQCQWVHYNKGFASYNQQHPQRRILSYGEPITFISFTSHYHGVLLWITGSRIFTFFFFLFPQKGTVERSRKC